MSFKCHKCRSPLVYVNEAYIPATTVCLMMQEGRLALNGVAGSGLDSVNGASQLNGLKDITQVVGLKGTALNCFGACTVPSTSGSPTLNLTAASFSPGQYLSVESNPDLVGGSSFGMAGWIYFNSGGGKVVASKGVVVGEEPIELEWSLTVGTGAAFTVSNNSGTTVLPVFNVSNPGWHFVAAWLGDGAMHLKIDDMDEATTESILPRGTTGPFLLGSDPSQIAEFDGRIEFFGFWKRPLTEEDIVSLKEVRSYADLSTSDKVDLVSWWDLDEPTGAIRVDHHSGYNLTDNGGVALGAGHI